MQKTKTKIKQNPHKQLTKTQKNPKQTRKGAHNKVISTVHDNDLATLFISSYNQHI